MLGLDLLKAKARAGLLHLIISALAVGVLAWLTLTVWYPDGLATLQGVWKILGLVAVVDVILGPALTVLVYKPRKRTLVFDLSVIALIQIAALTYGAWTISAQRPAYLAYMYDRFFVVTARDILDEPPATVQAIEAWRGGPRPVFVRLSFAASQEAAANAATAFDTPAMALLSNAYAPLPEHLDQFTQTSTAEAAGSPVLVIPVIGRQAQGTAEVDRQSGQLLHIGAN
ncbi:MAG: hypothetical protein KDH20_16885 [Rhodocyclaceae bacterium]|nr:hypothetical protein [Rhodocyclaceae bacterium]